jgi:phosphomannomutase
MPALSLKIAAASVRGLVGESLTPQLVTAFAAAFGNYCGRGPILVGVDGRASGEMLKQAAFAGLLSVGSAPVDLGVVPAPALMLHVRQVGAAGGINISGGESGPAWNALRFIGPDGSVLRANQAAELTDLYHQGTYARVRAQEIGRVGGDDTAVERHRAVVRGLVDATAIRARAFRVALPESGGPSAPAARGLLDALGCQVVTGDADLAFLLNADGDRLRLRDEHGAALPDHAALALAVDGWLGRRPGPAVITVATSQTVEDVAGRRGGTVFRTPVGETYAVEKMRDVGAEVGGDGDGGVIVAPVNRCRDGLAAMALVLEELAKDRAPMSERCAFLRARVLLRETLLCPAREIGPQMRWLRHVYAGQQLDFADGVRVSFGNRWLHVRPSSQEPILRLTAEATTELDAQRLLNEALEHLSPIG